MRGLASKTKLAGASNFTPTSASSNLRLVSSEDGHLLLDIEHDRVLKLNSVGAEIWKSLAASECESEIVRRLSQRYRVGEARVAADVRALRERLDRFGITPSDSMSAEREPATSGNAAQPSYPWYGQSTAEKPAPSVVAVMSAFIGLVLFELTLRLFSLKFLCSCVDACPVLSRTVPPNTSGKVCSAVERAAVWYPKQVVCFQRSAVTACLLRLYGLRARMMIGIRPLPLLLHSWVEISDGIVNDWRPVSRFYHTAASY